MDELGFSSVERLQHVADAIIKIQAYTKDVSEKKFMEESMINNSVLYQFLIIGEAIQNVDYAILKKYPYAWYLPRSFRNYIAHEYFGINLKQVYKTIIEVLPDFRVLIEKIILNEKN